MRDPIRFFGATPEEIAEWWEIDVEACGCLPGQAHLTTPACSGKMVLVSASDEGQKKNRAAATLSALGAAKGGEARARKLTAARRSEIARQGAMARLAKEGRDAPALAKYGAPDRPLRIGPIEIGCYVLADGRRVLSQRGLQGGIGMSEGGSTSGARKIADLMARLEAKGIDIKDLAARANSPIRFVLPRGGPAVDGYEATLLPDICAVIIDAARQGKLGQRLERMSERCAILQHGFATVGIIALVDEATGFQEFRTRDALALILERFVAKELRPWIRTFPTEFYRQIYRLNGWGEFNEKAGRPGVIGHWTTNVVYKRLAPGVWEELQRLTPRDAKGRLRNKLFQWLTDDLGHPKLREHLTGVIMLMKYSPDWRVFIDRLDREYPQWGSTLMLPFPEGYSGPGVIE